jgi:catechol 2,3-dioxygenase-like lactoylglutathione lyase family enzyme
LPAKPVIFGKPDCRSCRLDAPDADEPNLPMDVPGRHPRISRFALLRPAIMGAKARLEAAGIALRGGPIPFGPGAQGVFVRDPDRNVVELHPRGSFKSSVRERQKSRPD